MTTLGIRIKKAREDIGMSQSELALAIGIKPSSGVISNWERDLNKPDAEKIIKLCEVLDISVSYLLDYYGKSDFECTLSEQQLIEKYRNLDNHGIQAVNSILDIEYDRCVKDQEEIYYPKKYIDKLPNIASAGIGDYLLDEIPIEKIEVDNDCQADFAIGIDGDSMSPTYDHNDVVLVKRQNTINVGEIGIFIVDGECFIKEYAKDRLISHNKDYPDKIFNECMDIRLVGKVIGKLNQ